MATIVSNVLCLLAILSILLPLQVHARDDCANLFFTTAWHKCLQQQFKNTWLVRTNPFDDQSLEEDDDFDMPEFSFPTLPNVNDLIEQAQQAAHASHGHDSTGSFSSSSSSFTSGGNGVSKSVISSNGCTWTVESNGLSISTSDDGSERHAKVVIGEPDSLTSVIGDDNSLQVHVKYPDATERWVKVTLDESKSAKDLKINRHHGILYIEGSI